MGKISYFVLFVLLFAASCRAPRDLVYQNVQNFSIKQGSVAMDVRLYNPNSYRMKLKRADLDVYVNGKHLGKVETPKKITVTKLDTFTMPIMLAVDLKNVLPNMVQLLFTSEVDVRLTGKVKAGRHGLFMTIPIDYTGKQDIKQGIKW